MADNFSQVPDWGSWENQGAGVAAVDLDGDGSPELLVLRVDHPTPGPNAAFYRVGKKLTAAGTVASWGPWQAVPDWGANENQGSGLAVADLDGDGRPELIVFQVDHRVPGPNRGRYRVGRKLDAAGVVTGGWGLWREVPNWVSWRDQGAAIAVADLDGDGKPELIVFHIDDFHTDNPTRPNKGFYRVGRGLDATGQVTLGWGDWMEVDWFSWFNQGAGVAVADLNGDGKPELVVFQVDNPPGENAGFLRVGWGLDVKGKLNDGWGPWTPVDGWQSFEDQGGSLALADFGGGKPQAVVLHVDNPPGLNAGLYRVLPVPLDTDQAKDKGVWRLLPYFSEVLPVHAALLHTGKVLFFAGSGNSAVRFHAPEFGSEPDKIYTSVVWDFTANTFGHPPTLRRGNGRPIDFFCCGHCFLPDGRILVAGGTEKYDADTGGHFLGNRDAIVFDPVAEKWAAVKPMAHGRWYPTLTMLADGSVVASSGLNDTTGGVNNTLEVNADPARAAWVKKRDFGLPLYPHLFLMADGRLFFTGGKMDTDGDSVPFRFDPRNAAVATEVANGLRDVGRCNQSASVLLPPAQEQKVMILGGGPEDETAATDRVDVIDFTKTPPQYQKAARLNENRMHVNAVILPDRTVLAVGGGGTREAKLGSNIPQPINERLVAERFDPSLPAGGTWTELASAQVPRLYHSVALLLPDGRVVTAGGNPNKGSQADWLPPDPMEEMRLEIYSPPYLFKGPRPTISTCPTEIKYGTPFTVGTPQPGQIQLISLIRSGLTTHSFNGEQRLVDVPFTRTATGLTATPTGERNVAPPGWYMLFLTDNNRIPSVAHWVHLG